jgi:hypothetical protein
MDSFLATVKLVFQSSDDFLKLDKENDFAKIYNGNKNFDAKDARFLGAIQFVRNSPQKVENYAFPLDKNNVTFPIPGETVLIITNDMENFWLPYTVTQYPNYREDYKTTAASGERNLPKSDNSGKSTDYKENKSTGTPNKEEAEPESKKSQDKKYDVKDKIKFLKPMIGDTIISGRVGNTIRFSEFFLTEDKKTSSPAIFIRNKQNPELDSKKIGELIEEDINKDGTSVYIGSNKVKRPFVETIKKDKVGFTGYPSSGDLIGDQFFLNSDRVLLSAKAKEFIIFGKGNTGIITDGRFSVDAKQEMYLHNEKNITIHSKGSNQIYLNSDSGGKIFLGKDGSTGDDGAAVQHMVLGGELVKVLSDLIDAINQQIFLTPCGPSKMAPTNEGTFKSIQSKLKVIYSARNFLAKS